MRARLLVVNPDKRRCPRVPTLILEDGIIGVYQEDHAWPLEADSLEDVTREHLLGVLSLKPSVIVAISEVRNLPDLYLMSSEVISFCRSWWFDTVAAWKKAQELAKAS